MQPLTGQSPQRQDPSSLQDLAADPSQEHIRSVCTGVHVLMTHSTQLNKARVASSLLVWALKAARLCTMPVSGLARA